MAAKNSPALDFKRPLVTVDLAIFTVAGDALQVLLVKRPQAPDEPWPGRWALPGGFVDVDLDADLLGCATRKLHEKTRVEVGAPYLEQLGSWGGKARDPRGWSVTHAYFALVPHPGEPVGGTAQADWVQADEAAGYALAFDHGEILAAALERLRSKVEYTSLPAYLLAEPITLPQLQRTYETVLGRPLDKSAFRKRMLDAGFLEEAGRVPGGTSGRVAQGYRIRNRAEPAVFPRTFRSGEP